MNKQTKSLRQGLPNNRIQIAVVSSDEEEESDNDCFHFNVTDNCNGICGRRNRDMTRSVEFSLMEPLNVLLERIAGAFDRKAGTFVLKDRDSDRRVGAYETWWVKDGCALEIVAADADKDKETP